MTAIQPTAPPGAAPDELRKMFLDPKFVSIAREIAIDIVPVEQILENHSVSAAEWDEIQANAAFKGILRSQIIEWAGAERTADRVRLKSLAFVEESLPEFFARVHDPKESFQHKVKGLEVISKFAGLGGSSTGEGSGERLTVTINLGADQQLVFNQPPVTPEVTLDSSEFVDVTDDPLEDDHEA